MKKSTFKVHFVLPLCLLVTGCLFGQTPSQKAEITRFYNQELLAEMAQDYTRTFKEDFEAAKAYAAANNIPVVIERENGGIAVLHKVLEDGSLLYTSTTNEGAGVTVRANRLYSGPTGTLDLSVEGEGIVIGVWDGGFVLPSHELLENRVEQIDNATGLSSHATHVSGTIIGSGIPQNGSAKGMAPKATLLASDFGNDLGEMTPQAASGLLLSNHSYGIPAGNVSTAFLGSYSNGAAALDNLLYNTPYYTAVYSAGNDRNSGVNVADNGYDLLTGDKTSKNNIVVAAVNTVANYTGPNSVVMSGFSSWGPTDDGRIKPDISAKGVNTFSSVASGNNSYANFSGTSMSAPSVTGALALLQELHSDIHGTYMKSATLKALAIHTALEAGSSPGPDYRFGWGLLDTEAAAKALLKEGFESLVDENSLIDANTFTQTVTSNGVDPLIVTIVWTDPPGVIQPNVEDDVTPRLVNDLDIVLEDGSGNLFYPWRHSPMDFPGGLGNPAFKGVNDVDNVEKVEIDAPSGTYTIRVTHKGSLVNGLQDFSLIATGISESDFTFTPDNIYKQFCSNQVADFEFNYESSANFNGPTSLSVSGLPTGAVATFTPSVITADEDFVLEITGLDAISAGTYPFTVTASSATLTKNTAMDLEVVSAIPLSSTVLNFPNNGAVDVFIYPTLTWTGDSGASEYSVEVSETPDFSSIVFELTTTTNSVSVPGLVSNSQYYWRVKASSFCVEGDFTNASFTTEITSCENLVSAVDTPISIGFTPTEIESTINIPANEDVLIGDINITMDLTHSWLADLTISLTSPSGTEVILMDGTCGDTNNADVIFDDSGVTFSCSDQTPSVNGVMRAQNLLSPFISENSAGDWTLKIIDSFNQDGGSLNEFTLEFCATAGALSLAENQLEDFELFPNPAKEYFEFRLQNQNSKLNLNVYDVNGRVLISQRFSNQDRNIVNTSMLSRGIYFVEITNGDQKGLKKLIIK
ncbi:Por secretion system C-terminal sorting domain-containing protein [Formosa sp. Hel1_31_208]|uniref:S8 family serine peptidase n=1 Tax=Formosa sp. Hel1_31_208 TaxID=1798225 RepID=UPI00087D1A48|nr:S8 family serine peptidase [Formosa sp. Hel1_31_208]SDS25156.1 Por secretion system C-terminal sorting domain-containing protein [Formosa sp. Hel1_31_208]